MSLRSLLAQAFARTGRPVRFTSVGVRFAETTPESAQMDLLSLGRIQLSGVSIISPSVALI
jgi:hypothetical protein